MGVCIKGKSVYFIKNTREGAAPWEEQGELGSKEQTQSVPADAGEGESGACEPTARGLLQSQKGTQIGSSSVEELVTQSEGHKSQVFTEHS